MHTTSVHRPAQPPVGSASEPAPHPVLDRAPRMRTTAERFGLTCLSFQWRGATASYRWACPQGHVFRRSTHTLAYNSHSAIVCPTCREAHRLQRLHELAAAQGAECLDTQWRGPKAYYRFRCRHGHAWRRTGAKTLDSATCPTCAIERRNLGKRLADGLARLQAAAHAKGGVCLASTYEGVAAYYPFRCHQGHSWQARGSGVLKGKWCKRCATEHNPPNQPDPHGLQHLQALAAERSGACLSTVYLGTKAKHRFRCREGHVWEAVAQSILRGTWCRRCRYDGMLLGIEAARQWAEARGGRCLSIRYQRSDAKMHWQCHQGHTWHTTFDTVRAGHWCPLCADMAKIVDPNSTARKRYIAKE